MNFSERYSYYQNLINDYIESQFAEFHGNEKLLSSMKYSLSIGGKRVRPVIFLAVCDAFGVDLEYAMPLAFSLECVHTSSLIHDDLPSLDNDDMRRGKPSNHKVYGEDFAIIAGDALLNLAYEFCLSRVSSEKFSKVLSVLATASGYSGMLGGQAYDLENQFSLPNESTLLLIDSLKTAKLIKAPFVMAGVLADKPLYTLETLGEKVGLLFQFSDDLLDVVGDSEKLGKTVGKDEREGKVTAVTVFGTDAVRKKIDELKLECVGLCDTFDDFDFIKNLIVALAERSF